MRRLIACGVLAPLFLMTWTSQAHAGKSTDIALGLASFAVFNQIVAPLIRPPHVVAYPRREVVVHRTVVTQPVVYQPAPVVYAPPPVAPAPATTVVYPHGRYVEVSYATLQRLREPATTVVYPHGRYELQLHGHQYVWVWIPTLAPPPPPPPYR